MPLKLIRMSIHMGANGPLLDMISMKITPENRKTDTVCLNTVLTFQHSVATDLFVY